MNELDRKNLLDTIFDSSLDAIIFTDEIGYITEANKAFIELVGYSKAEVLGKHTAEFSPMKEGSYECTTGELIQIDKKFSDYIQSTMRTFMEGNNLRNVMGYQLRKDGRIVPVEDSMVFLFDDKGEKIGAFAVIRDITDRRQAEAKLRDSEEQARALLNVPVDVVLVLNNNGITLDCNKAYAERFNKSIDELKGTCCWNLYPPEVVKRRKKVVEKVFQTGKPIRAVDEREGRFLDNVTYPIFDKEGKVAKIAVFSRDVTEQKLSETALKASKDFLENIISSSLDAIVASDEHGCITKVNSAYCQLTGYSEADILGKNVVIFSPLKQGNYQCTTGELIQIDKEYIDKVVKDRVREFTEKNKLRDKISFFLRKDNVLVPIEYNMTSLFGDSGESIGAFAVIRDITERKKTEEELFNYQERLKALTSQIALTEEQERRRFAGFLHDEIGQQLFATQIQLGYLKDSLSSVQNIQQVDDAIDNIKKVMTSSRSLTAELSPPVLYELGLEKALEWLAEQAHEKYDIVVTFKDDKKEKLLDDDVKILLYQTVRELLINVAKHAQTKKASVSIKKEDSSVRICVEDNGVGFDSSSKDYSDGEIKGFGLFHIKERLEPLGGQLEIESQPSHGTTVNLVVPLSRIVDNQ